MVKKTIITVLALLVAFAVQAQKPVIFAGTFNTGEKVEATHAILVRSAIVAGLHKTGRFELKDVDAARQIAAETERRSSEDALGDATALMEQSVETAAEYLLYGAIPQCSFEEEKQEDGTMQYTAELTYTVKIVKYANKEIVVSKDFNLSGLRCGIGDSPESAVANALAHVENDMKNLVDEYFKLEGTILSEGVEKDKKGRKMVACLIDLGSDHGMTKGQRLEVSCSNKIAGRDVSQVIGTITITEVMAGDLSKCKVNKGDEELLKKYNEYLEIKDTAPDKAIPLKVKTIKQSAAKNLLKQGGAMFGF